ncbi:MAG: DNA internalization-related competence protein ComEC/Rec2, partial [Gammaproteobacteria bacterium]
MRLGILGWVMGAALLQMQPALPTPVTLGLLASAALLMMLLRRAACAVAAGALLGFCWAAVLVQLALAPRLAAEDEGADIRLVGTVDSLPYRFEDGVRFNFRVEKAGGNTHPIPPLVTLAWYSGYRARTPTRTQSVGDVQPGERWALTVRLQRPHGTANPYGFDYEAWLLEQGVRATGYVRPAGKENRMLDSFVFSVPNLVQHCRAVLRARILAALPDRPYAGVIVALVVGDQRSIEQDDWTVFNRTGIGHLISISGLHVTMVAGLFAMGASLLWRRSFFTQAQLPLLLPSQKVAALVGALAALMYVLLAGFGVPAQRTLYMLWVVAAAAWCDRLTSVSHVLCLALGVVVLADPWAVCSPGFWLSFGAVALILFASLGRVEHADVPWRRAVRLAVRTQVAVTVGLVPLTMLLFGQVSLVSPLANAVAIPLISFVVTPLALAGSLLPGALSTLCLLAAHGMVATLAQVLGWLASAPLAVWSAPMPGPVAFALALLGTLWMLAPRGWPLRWTGAVAWLPLLAAQPDSPPPGRFRVIAFDVGQGMALLVETGAHRLLYDTGPAYSNESNGANRVLLPYLKGRGIGRLDALIVSHSDVDHSGGALALLGGVQVQAVLSSLPPAHAIVRAAAHHQHCAAGQAWTWDGVRFEMLHPSPDSYADVTLKPNARSCTLRISYARHAVLLAGDIEAPQETQLLAGGAPLAADVLLAPHHGSGTSSTPAFLSAV